MTKSVKNRDLQVELSEAQIKVLVKRLAKRDNSTIPVAIMAHFGPARLNAAEAARLAGITPQHFNSILRRAKDFWLDAHALCEINPPFFR